MTDIRHDYPARAALLAAIGKLVSSTQPAHNLRALGHELQGVLDDLKNGAGFDNVCRQTVERVCAALLSTQPAMSQDAQPVAYVSEADMERLRANKWAVVEVSAYETVDNGGNVPLYPHPPIPQAGKVPEAQWQPIETAPKNWDTVLLAEGDYVDCGFWHDGSECYGHRGGAGWFSECDRANLLTARNIHPTHWMPFPCPPRSQVQGGLSTNNADAAIERSDKGSDAGGKDQ